MNAIDNLLTSAVRFARDGSAVVRMAPDGAPPSFVSDLADLADTLARGRGNWTFDIRARAHARSDAMAGLHALGPVGNMGGYDSLSGALAAARGFATVTGDGGAVPGIGIGTLIIRDGQTGRRAILALDSPLLRAGGDADGPVLRQVSDLMTRGTVSGRDGSYFVPEAAVDGLGNLVSLKVRDVVPAAGA